MVFLLPIVPNPSEYVKSVIEFLLPILAILTIHFSLKKEKEEEVTREKRKSSLLTFIVPASIVIVLVYLVSGNFKYYAIAIASGSMKPTFDRGTVVIVEQINKNYDKIQVGDILTYNHDKRIVVHRVTNIQSVSDEFYFYTKGDANLTKDNYKILEENIVGVVKVKIPWIGYPTVILSEL